MFPQKVKKNIFIKGNKDLLNIEAMEVIIPIFLFLAKMLLFLIISDYWINETILLMMHFASF